MQAKQKEFEEEANPCVEDTLEESHNTYSVAPQPYWKNNTSINHTRLGKREFQHKPQEVMIFIPLALNANILSKLRAISLPCLEQRWEYDMEGLI
jgi:hypothetical protein